MQNKLKPFIIFLHELQKISKCKDRQTAAIIISKDLQQIFAIGINGGPKGYDDCICNRGKYSCVHAEINALIKCTDFIQEKILICTLQPCTQCMATIKNSKFNIQEVWYLEDWKEQYDFGIICKKIEDV